MSLSERLKAETAAAAAAASVPRGGFASFVSWDSVPPPVRAFVSRLQNLVADYASRAPEFLRSPLPRFWDASSSTQRNGEGDGGEDGGIRAELDEDDIFCFGNMPIQQGTRTSGSQSSLGKGTTATSASAATAAGTVLFIDTYTDEALWKIIREHKFGGTGAHSGETVEEALAAAGFTDLVLQVDTADTFVHKMHLFSGDPVSRNLLVQLFVRRETGFSVMETKSFAATENGVPQFYAAAFSEGIRVLRAHFSQRLQMLVIEWLRMQNPRRQFPPDRLPLPGQNHPGLGIAVEVDYLLADLATRKNRDGILNIPEHWCNAYLYSKGHVPYRFLNPSFEGYFQSICAAVEDDIATKGLAAVAWAIFRGLLHCMMPNDPKMSAEAPMATGPHGGGRVVPIRWVPQEQVMPLSQRMRDYFESPEYTESVKKHYHPELFAIMWDSPDSELSASCPS